MSLQPPRLAKLPRPQSREKSVQTDGVPALRGVSPVAIAHAPQTRHLNSKAISKEDSIVNAETASVPDQEGVQLAPCEIASSALNDEKQLSENMSELKLNLDGVEGGITEAVAPSVTSFSSSSLLPSVKGSSVDYVHANRDSASQLGLHRRL